MTKRMVHTISLALYFFLACCGCGSSGEPQTEPSPLQESWRFSYDMAGGVRTAPLVLGDSLVFFSANARLTALHLDDGSLKWKSSKTRKPVHELYCRELLAGDGIIFGSHVDRALAWKLENGNRLWKFAPPIEKRFFELGYFALGPNHFFGSGKGGRIFAIGRETGQLAYEHRYQYGAFGMNYSKGAIFFTQAWTPEGAEGQSQGGIMKVDAATGDSLWNFRTPRGGFYRMRPLVDEGTVYAGTRGGENTVFVALDAETGEVIWRNPRARVYAAEMADGKIFVNTGSDLMALDKDDGRTLWRAGLNAGHGESGLAYLDGYVYHPHGQAMRVVNAESGEIVHIEAPPDGSYFWEVGASAGTVFAQSSGYLVAYEPYQPE